MSTSSILFRAPPSRPVRPRRWRSALAAAVAVALSACSSTPLAPTPVARGDVEAVQQQLRAFIAHELRHTKMAGLSIALVDDQQVVAAFGAGWADVAAQRPASADTLYRMGSVSKLLTDTAAMQLVADGKLQLDAPIEHAVPGFRIQSRWPAAPITARQLMTHHSGLPRDVLAGMWVDAAAAPAVDFRRAVAGLAMDHLAQPPGLAFAYSNVGIDLLGVAVERLSGTPFETHMQRAVLAPLGMRSASFSAAPPASPPGSPPLAQAYMQGALQQEPALRDVPAGGLTASVSDMAQFLKMQFAHGRNAQGERVLPEAQWAQMLQAQNDAVPLDVGFQVGLGWMLSTVGVDTVHGGGPVAHHNGATFFHRSQLMMLPAQRVGVVVAANDSASGAVVNRVAQRALALMLEAKAGVAQPPRVPGFVPARTPWPDEALDACVGDYISLLGPLSVRREGSALRVRADDKQLELLPGEEGRLGLRYKLGGLVPVPLGVLSEVGVQCRQIDGRHTLVARLDGQELLAGDRLAPVTAPVPAELAALAGRYEPVLQAGERPTIEAATLVVAGDRLWVSARMAPAFGGEQPGRLPLQVLNAQQAVLLSGPLGDAGPVITRRTGSNGVDEFEYSGWTFRKVKP
jgi:CubicO group peptidase (beta-lactamase class C family)